MHPGIKSWKYLLTFAWNFFSAPLLVRTLFAPYKLDKDTGSNFVFLEHVVFLLFVRVLGFIFRVLLILVTFVFVILVIVSFPIFFFIPVKIEPKDLQDLGSMGSSLSYGSTFTLNKHGFDLITPYNFRVIGKEKALRMVERGLDKDTRHNVLLLGENGVGKTTLAMYLGRLGLSGLSFPGIRRRRVVALNIEGMSLEDFDKCMIEAEKAHNVVIVIENIHLYPNLFERMMPYLEMEHVGIIATTDLAGYDGVLKAHSEFLGKFEKVEILPMSKEETMEVLRNEVVIKGIKIKPEALEEIVRLADRFIVNVPEPAKSLSILEELRTIHRKITVEDVQQIVSDKTNMPIGNLEASEKEVLLGLEDSMKAKIIGQDKAVMKVSEAMKRLRTGVADPSKPAASFLFLGPTGVGKTYTAKILAESYFGSKEAMVRFDMSEFSLSEDVQTFTDRLGAILEERPLSLVFFDELEKANKAIHNLLLQVLDEGHLTRESGRMVSFKDSLIIATTNAGSAEIMRDPDISKDYLVRELVRQKIFTPEFLNRFSELILFKPLSQAQVRVITRLMIDEFAERLLADKGIKLEVSDEAVNKVAEAGFDLNFGARPIKRAIEEHIENAVADAIIAGANSEGVLKIG